MAEPNSTRARFGLDISNFFQLLLGILVLVPLCLVRDRYQRTSDTGLTSEALALVSRFSGLPG